MGLPGAGRRHLPPARFEYWAPKPQSSMPPRADAAGWREREGLDRTTREAGGFRDGVLQSRQSDQPRRAFRVAARAAREKPGRGAISIRHCRPSDPPAFSRCPRFARDIDAETRARMASLARTINDTRKRPHADRAAPSGELAAETIAALRRPRRGDWSASGALDGGRRSPAPESARKPRRCASRSQSPGSGQPSEETRGTRWKGPSTCS